MPKKIFKAFIFVLLFTLLFTGCNSTPKATEPNSEDPTEAPTEKPTLKPTSKPTEKPTSKPTSEYVPVYDEVKCDFTDVHDLVKMLGRARVVNDGITCDFTASGIEFYAYVDGEISISLECSAETYFTVFVDGERYRDRYKAEAGFNTITFDTYVKGFHEIKFYKQTEPQHSTATLNSIEFYGELVCPAPNKDILIEFIGDSITCGYGNLWTPSAAHSSGESGTPLYEDGTQAYSFLTAQALEADHSIVSFSGIGLDKGYSSINMQQFYTKDSYMRSPAKDYEPEARTPDIVVINLGTNDNSQGSSESQMKANVRTLIETVRENYGEDTPIIWAHNMMGACRFEWTSEVLESLGGEENGIYSIQLTQNNQGGNGHPSLAAHEAAAKTLAEYIEELGILD